MQVKYSFPYWGSDHITPIAFIEEICRLGFEGAELFLQGPGKQSDEFMAAIESIRKKNSDFYFIALQLSFPIVNTAEEHIKSMRQNFKYLASLNPFYINSHTGKDFFSFDDNCRIIEAALNFSVQHGIRILHETHRGRFSFHAASLIPYLEKFPEMELVGDFSHFCVVSESMLDDQEETLSKIIPHVSHVHARIGHEQSPQINDPQAPEWHPQLQSFLNWWKRIADFRKNSNQTVLTITPEFGPAPYMPALPYSRQPLSNQWDNNVFMMNYLKANL